MRAVLLCFVLASARPTPSDIEQLICQLATNKQVEDRATGAICTAMKAKPDCVTALEGVWGTIAAKFPQDCKGLPSPADVEKLICKIATQETIEEQAVVSVCSYVNKTFPNVQFNPDCKTMLQDAWDLIAVDCPKEHELALATLPNPTDIEKLVCKLASQKMIEDRAEHVICSLINNTFPNLHLLPDCKTLVGGAWDLILSRCPKGNEELDTLPSPAVIEKLVCGVVTKPPVQQKATHAICSRVHRSNCEAAVAGVFKAVAEECQSSAPLPAQLEKLACELAEQKGLEEKAATAVCTTIHAQLPAIPAWACKLTLKKKWAAMEARCPKELVIV